ncbi:MULTISPECIES: EamA family transporter [Streptomyces]|uniref:EamA family transporter n=1 Tax=Streptomyces TaxID=1883 RepID=UPI0027E56A2E|nr:EamA family transporter [Streptomyces sp. MCA2]
MKQPFILIHPSTLWVLLAVGVLAAAVAVLSSVLPYTFHLEALRRVPPRVFGILTSLEPAVGALIGLVLLGQHLGVPQWAGVTAVALASIGATRAPSRAPKPTPPDRPSGTPDDLTSRTPAE